MTGILDAVTWLFVPATRPDRFAKAAGAGADVVILDLEDAVPAAEKAAAREHVRANWPVATQTIVRVNARDTAEYEADVSLCREIGPAAVMLPKASGAEDVAVTAHRSGCRVVPLVESGRGLVNLGPICGAEGTARLAFGSIDLALDLGVTADEALDHARADLVRWSAAARLAAPVDGVTPALTDSAAVERDAVRARAWGFRAKMCIHPAQLPAVRAAMRPTAEEAAWARRVVDAAERAGGSAASLDGVMIDHPVVERARRVLAPE